MIKLTREDYFFCNSVIAKMFNNQKSGIPFPWARHDKTGQDRGHRGETGDTGDAGDTGDTVASHSGVFRGARFSPSRDERAPLKTPAGEARDTGANGNTGSTLKGTQGTHSPQVPQGTQET